MGLYKVIYRLYIGYLGVIWGLHRGSLGSLYCQGSGQLQHFPRNACQYAQDGMVTGGFQKNEGFLFGVTIRTIVFSGSILGSPYFGKLPLIVPERF